MQVGICLLITPSPEYPFKGQESKMPIVFVLFVCEHMCNREGETETKIEKEGGGATRSLSKLIRRGIRMEVKYWATCNERSRVGDI